MGSNSRNPRIVHFGDCVLDLETAELRRNGTKTSLQTQPFQILTALLENPGQLVTREELTKRLWPTGTFVDFDQSLNKAVARLRESLGDDAEQPRYIETLSRRGYRWKAPVKWKKQQPGSIQAIPRRGDRFIGTVDENPSDRDPTPDDSKSGLGRRKALWIVGGVVVLLFATVVLWRTRGHHSDPSLPSLEVVPLVALHGFQGYPAFSPDGNQVAFTRYEGDDQAIYAALIGGNKPLRLTTKSGVCCPTWSPDNRQIAFMRFL